MRRCLYIHTIAKYCKYPFARLFSFLVCAHLEFAKQPSRAQRQEQ